MPAPEAGLTTCLWAPWAPKAVLYATPCHAGELLLFDPHQPAVLRTLPAGDAITSVAASPDGLYVAAGTSAGAIALLSADGEKAAKLKGHNGPPGALAFAADSGALYSACGPVLMVWNRDVALRSAAAGEEELS